MKILLLPFSWLFRFGVFIRNLLYNYGYFKITYLNSRVISVGNINSGGTGKTPFAEFITRYFLERGKFVVLLTKGYKRESDDMQVVELGYKNEDKNLTTENFGDESMMILEDFMDEPSLKKGKGLLIVSDNKRSGAKLADSKFKPDVIIIDDGFQHRELGRNLDLVVLNPEYKGSLIPAGTFREPYSSTKRADLKVLNYKFYDTHDVDTIKLGEIPRFNYELDGFYDINCKQLEYKGQKSFAFCGIGDHDSFKQLLGKNKINITEFIHFPDHHNFTDEDIKRIIDKFKSTSSEIILTTQKDFVRFRYSQRNIGEENNITKEFVNSYLLFYSKIRLNFTQNQDILINKLNETVGD